MRLPNSLCLVSYHCVMRITGLLFMLSLSAFAGAVVSNPVVTQIPYDAGIKQRPFITSSIDLTAYDYVEEEFRMSGVANVYDKEGSWRSDGIWDVKVDRADQPYATRLLVRRPAIPENFNGIVVVEWFNNTAFMDVDVIWAQSHQELLREGYAWIGVSAQYFGVNMLKSWDGERYGDMHLPNDGYSYDIFSQAGLAVREYNELLLGGFDVKGVIGAGESQSAIRLTTYVNAFQDDAASVYDAMLIYSRFHLASPLKAGITLLSPSRAYIRPDNRIKIIQFETEQDLFMFLFRLARQDDTDRLRTWELPGASHYDDYGVSTLLPQYQRDFPLLSNIELGCKNPLNQIPQHYVVNAALSSLSRWIVDDKAPPQAAPIEYRFWRVVRDQHGNAKGGIRLPELEVPTAKHNYANYGVVGGGGNLFVNAFACPFLGNTVPFDEEKLKTLYSTHEEYVHQYVEAADAAREAGFLLPADYDEAVARAEAAAVP